MIFNRKQDIGKYTVAFSIKEGEYAETYRVKDYNGKNYFLKLINCSKLHSDQFANDGEIMEEKVAKNLCHPNLLHYHDCGRLVLNGGAFVYLVFDFISGETLAERLNRDDDMSVYEAKNIAIGILNGLKFMHGLSNPLIHNEITPDNIMLDMSGDMPIAKLIDFGHARFLNDDNRPFNPRGLNPFYMSPELLNGVYTCQSDIFSIGAVLYRMIYGNPPYFVDLTSCQKARGTLSGAMEEVRSKPLRFPESKKFELDEQIVNILAKALSVDVEERFQTADEFIKALDGQVKIDSIDCKKKVAQGGLSVAGGCRCLTKELDMIAC